MSTSVPSNLRRRKVNSDPALAKIARELTGWTVVRPFSGLSDVDEETIRANYKDMEEQRFQFLRQWKKKNPNGTFQDLAEMFRQAERMDMVEITCKVAGEETEQNEGVNDNGMNTEHNEILSSEEKKSTCGKSHSTQFWMCMVLALILLLAIAGCAYFGMRWADGDTGKTASGIETFKRMATNMEGEHNLPWFPPPFIGRDENVSHITNMLLLDSRIRGVHITGAPAIGKSHLAVHVGYELVGHGVNIKYIDVSEIQLLHVRNPKESVPIVKKSSNSVNKDSTAMARRGANLMLSLFSPQEEKDISVSSSTLVNWARGVKSATTIILDNCDDVLQGALIDVFLDFIQKLQKASKYIKTISTSRVQFSFVGVKHFPLEGLEEKSSTDLLQQECEKFQVEEVKTVADLVGHNPLGLRLAAKLACDVMTAKELIKSLRANSVKTLSSETISKKQKMQFVIKTSIKYLETESILCARNISLFPGSFSKDAGVSILSGCGVEDAIYCLNTLSHKSLLEWYAVRKESRYRYHQLVRDAFVASDLLKDTHHFSNRLEAEEMFFEHYSAYFITQLKETLKECETGLNKYCEYWIQDEEINIEYLLTTILQFSPQKSIKYHLYWSEIVKNPIFPKIYGAQKFSNLLHREMDIIVYHLKQTGEWDVSLGTILHELIEITTQWAMYLMTVVYISSLLMSMFRVLLQSQSQSNSIVGVVGMNILAGSASLLASTTPALYTTWLVQFYISYTPPMVDIPHCTALLSFYILPICAVQMDLKLLRIFWLCFLHSPYGDFGPVLFSLVLFILIFVAFFAVPKIVVFYGLYLFLCLLCLYFHYGDFLSPPVPLILLSKVIIVLWIVLIFGIKSFLNIFLILLVVCADNHFLKPSSFSLHQLPIT